MTDSLLRDAEPFPDQLIKQLPPRGDDYVEWFEYAQRLMLHHPDHEYRVLDVQFADGTWAVTVEFVIDGKFYGGVGEANTPTAAESNAYKRALAHRRIGLHLYDRDGYWLHRRLLREETTTPSVASSSLPVAPPADEAVENVPAGLLGAEDAGETTGDPLQGARDPSAPNDKEAAYELGALVALKPIGQWTPEERRTYIDDLYELMWQCGLWGGNQKEDDIAAADFPSLDVAGRADLLQFAKAARTKAEPELVRLR